MHGLCKKFAVLAAFAGLAVGCDAPGTEAFTGADVSFTKSANAPVTRVSGGGTVDVPAGRSVYTFHSSLDGNGAVKGSFQLHFSSIDANVRGDVTCLLVTGGNFARLTGTVTASSDESLMAVGTTLHWQAVDNGEGSNAPADRITAFFVVPNPTFCDYATQAANDWTNGNVQIK